MRGNSTWQNFNLGMDNGGFGSTANDFLDPDAGANLLQNTPVFDASWTGYNPVTGAVDVWALGFRGQGVVVMNADNGINPNHGDIHRSCPP